MLISSVTVLLSDLVLKQGMFEVIEDFCDVEQNWLKVEHSSLSFFKILNLFPVKMLGSTAS